MPGARVSAWEGERCYFQIGLPEPGRPSRGHFSVTVRMTSSLMRISRPHSRFTSGGHLFVASSPIFDPMPDDFLKTRPDSCEFRQGAMLANQFSGLFRAKCGRGAPHDTGLC